MLKAKSRELPVKVFRKRKPTSGGLKRVTRKYILNPSILDRAELEVKREQLIPHNQLRRGNLVIIKPKEGFIPPKASELLLERLLRASTEFFGYVQNTGKKEGDASFVVTHRTELSNNEFCRLAKPGVIRINDAMAVYGAKISSILRRKSEKTKK